MTVSELAAMIGAITGPAGLLIAILVYFRDRATVTVDLQWDMETFGTDMDPDKTYFVVTIRNVGRRPIYLSHAHILLPPGADTETSHILLTSGLQGVTLAEGAPPYIVHADQEGMEKYAAMWWKLRATVIDAAGKCYHSDWPTKAPSWAQGVTPSFGALTKNCLCNWIRRRLP